MVTATRFAEPAQSLPLGVSVITADDIRASGAATVNEALMRILGVVGRQDFFGGGEYNLDLRGFGATADNNQVVIVDGLRVSEADLGGTRLAGIPIESVERIEVLRGSGAVLYGEGATGGVIVITTKAGTGKERRNAASVYAGAGSHALRDLRASATLASGGFSLDVAGQKRDTDNHRDNFRAETRRGLGDRPMVQRLAAPGRARVARDSLDTGLPGALTRRAVRGRSRARPPRPTITPHIRNARGSVFAEAQLGNWQLGGGSGHAREEAHQPQQRLSVRLRHRRDELLAARAPRGRAGRRQEPAGAGHRSRRAGRREVLGAFGSTASAGQPRLVCQGRLHAGRRHAAERRARAPSASTRTTAAPPPAWRTGSRLGARRQHAAGGAA